MARVGIVGCGYVGLVTGACLAEIGHEVLAVDRDETKVRTLESGGVPIYEPGLEEVLARARKNGRIRFGRSVREAVEHGEVVFICVHTPPRRDGSADLSFVEGVTREIAEHLPEYRLVVEKSTVPVRTGRRVAQTMKRYAPPGASFDVASNPEFLREGSAVSDFLRPDRIVLGVESDRAERLLREIYRPIDAPLLVTDIESAEIIKHASNAFLATKISFINLVAEICEAAGADVEKVAEGMGLDPRIGPSFLRAGIGYGGSCFPKDISAFRWIAENLGVDGSLFAAVEAANVRARARLLAKIREALWVVSDKQIAIWGLSFKPNTDDLREAPAIAIAQELLEEGARLRLHDPVAMEKARAILPPSDVVEYFDDPLEAARGAAAVVLATEWDDYRKADLRALREALETPILLDGRNLYDPETMRALGFTYYAMGRPPVVPR